MAASPGAIAQANASYPVRAPGWQIIYRGVPISGRIERMVLAITYTSHESGAAPELEITLEDRDKRWQGPWFPQRGDIVAASIGYAGEALAPCGEFQVDEVELTGPPDKVRMKCIAAYITPAMRTPNSKGYENQSLVQIARTIAGKHGLTLVSAPEPINVTFDRKTQAQEGDLEFLHRIAVEHNYDFTVRGKQLVFYSRSNLEAQPAAFAIARTSETKFSFKTRTKQIYKAATVTYFNPDLKKDVTATVTANPPVPNGDTLKINERCENGQQAALKARAALHGANMLLVTGTITAPGSTQYAAGLKATISGFGQFDNDYMLATVRHRLDRKSGYSAEMELRSVA